MQTPAVERFQPSKVTLEQIYKKAQNGGQGINADILAESLRGVFGLSQIENNLWAESRFKQLRESTGNPLLDGILVNPQGRMRFAWSTYQMYRDNKVVDLQVSSLFAAMSNAGELLIPLTPKRDNTYFWLGKYDDTVIPVMAKHVPDGLVDLKKYGETRPNVLGFGAMVGVKEIHMTRGERGVIGDRKFAEGGLVHGRLGFWERQTAEGVKFAPRVSIKQGAGINKNTYISPIQFTELLLTGGLPMNENHPNVGILRTDPEITAQDFIIAALLVFDDQVKRPLILRYSTYRPWLNEVPHHGN